MAHYYVGQQAIKNHNGRILEPGARVRKGDLNREAIEEHLKTGWVVKDDPREAKPVALMDSAPLLGKERESKGDELKKKASRDLEPEDKKKIKQEGLWNLDPDMLQDRTLDQLNVMVQERQPGYKHFKTRKGAIKRLSSDYRGA